MDKGRAFVGDRRAIRMHKSYWENRDYSDDNSLMKTAIDNYMKYLEVINCGFNTNYFGSFEKGCCPLKKKIK